MADRTITFAGPLGFGDVTLSDDGMVTIDREPHDYLGEFLAREAGQAALAAGGAALAAAKRTSEAWTAYPAASRSARHGMRVQACWSLESAGKNIGDVCRDISASLPGLDDFEPGSDLETWLLPLVDFTLQFLVTPADPVSAP